MTSDRDNTAALNADLELETKLRAALELGSKADSAATARVTTAWVSAAATHARPGRPATRCRWPWASASALAGLGLATLAGILLSAPSRALAGVAGAMRKVERFHIHLSLPSLATEYEAWGQRRVGVRVEERDNDGLTSVIVDDGQRLRRWESGTDVVHQSPTRLRRLFRRAANFNASRLLRRAANGEFLGGEGGEDWLGRPTARSLSNATEAGIPAKRLVIDLSDGFFERMVLYTRAADDRVLRAELLTDRRHAESRSFCRVRFEYPASIPTERFRFDPPPGTRLETERQDPLPL